MSINIACVPIDKFGNLLWIKNCKQNGKILTIEYKSSYNDMPFMETNIYTVDGGQNIAIMGSDGTILYRFSINWLDKILES